MKSESLKTERKTLGNNEHSDSSLMENMIDYRLTKNLDVNVMLKLALSSDTNLCVIYTINHGIKTANNVCDGLQDG